LGHHACMNELEPAHVFDACLATLNGVIN